MSSEYIIIVDKDDACIGSMEKMLVHQQGILHRAFSILLFDDQANMLIQKRSSSKYHSPLLWANACCSHQRVGESLEEAAHRRLYEELGISNIKLNEAFVMHYKYRFENALIENEIDHVYIGQYFEKNIDYNREEIEQVAWVSLDYLKQTITQENKYAYWFRLIMEKLLSVDYDVKQFGIDQSCFELQA